MNQTGDRIEILSVSLLDELRPLVNEMHALSKKLDLGMGWHYPMDLSWAANQLNPKTGSCVLDAGAGPGLIQWWLSSQGVNVISVDRLDRSTILQGIRVHFPLKGMREEDLCSSYKPRWTDYAPPKNPSQWHKWPDKLSKTLQKKRAGTQEYPDSLGQVTVYNTPVTQMERVEDESVDVIVSISALEHNTPDELPVCVAELMRVLKPGGKLVATLGAAKDEDWFHEASKGWCYTDGTLRKMFDLNPACPSNYEKHDELMKALRDCAELSDNLSRYYFESGDNGMPWGKWDPKYQSVGIVKVKPNI